MLKDERCKEIWALIKDGKDNEINKEEALEFYNMLTDEEQKQVLELCRANQRKAEYDRHKRRMAEMDYSVWSVHRIFEHFKHKEIIDKDSLLQECEEFFEKISPGGPKLTYISDLNMKIYECPRCGTRISMYQPFCHDCMKVFEWEEE